eukprot:Amastigsp_a510190_15.p4 type:complete len:117 gc:universal Amastigsp_a510190_15:687-337(-)
MPVATLLTELAVAVETTGEIEGAKPELSRKIFMCRTGAGVGGGAFECTTPKATMSTPALLSTFAHVIQMDGKTESTITDSDIDPAPLFVRTRSLFCGSPVNAPPPKSPTRRSTSPS